MERDSFGMAEFVLGLLLGSVVIGFCVGGYSNAYWKRQIQIRGYSEYCQTDGSWSWKGECK